jgi:hypothetical protein
MLTRLKVLAFKLSNRLLNWSTGLSLATVGMNTDADRITMLIYTTPGLAATAQSVAQSVATDVNVEPATGTVH